jgi:hypothetical protein
LRGKNGRGLAADLTLEPLAQVLVAVHDLHHDLPEKPLERELADEELGGLLVLADLCVC